MTRRQLDVLGRLRRHARDDAAVALAELRRAITAREEALAGLAAKRCAEAGACPSTLLGDWSRWVEATRRIERDVRAELEELRRLERNQEAELLRLAADHRALELVLEREARDARAEAHRRTQARLDDAALRAPRRPR